MFFHFLDQLPRFVSQIIGKGLDVIGTGPGVDGLADAVSSCR
jgi:hypothetical protein